jgi:hypothetical protein
MLVYLHGFILSVGNTVSNLLLVPFLNARIPRLNEGDLSTVHVQPTINH